MKKVFISITVMMLLLFLQACNQSLYIQSRPVGYQLVSNDYAAKGTFLYDSQRPYNINEIQLTIYLLPHLWGEIIDIQADTLSVDDPSFVILESTDNLQTNRRAFVKYIMINNAVWTAHLEGETIIYRNDEGIDLIDFLDEEEQVKHYIEAIDNAQAYFLNHEYVMLLDYESQFQKESFPFQLFNTKMVMINYAEELVEMPNISQHFPDYNSQNIITLFARVYEKRNEVEFKTSEYKG